MFLLKELSVLEHLDEVRKRLISFAVVLGILFIIGIIFSNTVIKKVQHDLIPSEKITIITISPLQYFYTQMMVSLVIAIVLAIPYLLYQLLSFIRPALSKKEMHATLLIIPAIVLLFIAGVFFCYYAFLKYAVLFFASLGIQGNVTNMWGIEEFLSFVLYSCLGFGLVFQLPLLLYVLYKLKIISKEFLKKQRKYVYVALFIAAAVITPQTDAVSMLIMATVLIILYELSLILIRIFA